MAPSKFVQAATALRVVSALLGLVAFFGLSACSYPVLGPNFTTEAKTLQAETFTCCADPEKFYFAPFAELALALGEVVGPDAATAAYGEFEETEFPGTLTGKTEAHEKIRALLRPLDILVISNKSYQLGRLMPGQFSHSMIYIGTEAQLRAAGLWSLPEVVPYHDQIRAGKIFMESATPDVHLMSTAKAFEVDRVVAMHPHLTAKEKRVAMARVMASIGSPFNYSMDLDPNNQEFVCTGLISYAMPGLDLTQRRIYARSTILPDDVASQAIRGDKLDLITYVIGTDEGYTPRSTFALMVDLAAYWGVPHNRP
jgi:hypothetical protein